MGNANNYKLASKICDYVVNQIDFSRQISVWDIEKILEDNIPLERVVMPKIANIVKDIMQEGFEIAMGGSMDLSEEANRKEQTARYDRAVKNYTEIIVSITECK